MPKRYDTDKDKNFDDLAHRFKDNIYGRLKGQIRLAVLERDLAPYLSAPLTVVDAGGGQGQFAMLLARRGHRVSLCDISGEMLKLARENAAAQGIDNVSFIHCALQQLQRELDEPADLLLCHAVLEWLAEPGAALACLHRCLKPGGLLSLAFFNVNSIIYKNLLRANYRKVASGNFVGVKGSLTPINPLASDEVFGWCEALGLVVLQHSGIRVFHDYIPDHDLRNRHPEAVIDMELKFSQLEPYRSLGRYIHVVLQKSSPPGEV